MRLTALLLTMACTATPPAPEEPLSEQARRGRGTYLRTCATCHQQDGTGLKGAFPPLAGSEWVTADPGLPIRVVLGGLQGEISVGRERYTGTMLSHRDILSDDQIADVLTYVRAAWGNNAGPVQPAAVSAVREATADRDTAWTAADLKQEGLL